jgi:uncharacterized DUF497 family protein
VTGVDREFQFEWDENKAAANVRKHGVAFELASTVFHDPGILTIPDLEHGEGEERWFSVGCTASGLVIAVAYLWLELAPGVVKIRLISARRATTTEMRQYEEMQ